MLVIALIVVVPLVVFFFALFAAAGNADDSIERWELDRENPEPAFDWPERKSA